MILNTSSYSGEIKFTCDYWNFYTLLPLFRGRIASHIWYAIIFTRFLIHTENRYPRFLLGSGISEKGENHCIENLPNTAWMDFQRDFLTHVASSFFSASMPVSSYQMADTCVPNIMDVNSANNNPSNIKKSRKIIVAGGEKAGHSFQSLPMHPMKWFIARKRAWNDMKAIYNVNST